MTDAIPPVAIAPNRASFNRRAANLTFGGKSKKDNNPLLLDMVQIPGKSGPVYKYINSLSHLEKFKKRLTLAGNNVAVSIKNEWNQGKASKLFVVGKFTTLPLVLLNEFNAILLIPILAPTVVAFVKGLRGNIIPIKKEKQTNDRDNLLGGYDGK